MEVQGGGAVYLVQKCQLGIQGIEVQGGGDSVLSAKSSTHTVNAVNMVNMVNVVNARNIMNEGKW